MQNQEVTEIIELKKHSSLIQISSKKLTLIQRKIFNSLLYLSARQLQYDNSLDTFRIKFTDLVRFAGYADSNNRTYIKSALQELTETSVQTNILGKDSVNTWSTFSLLAQADIKDFDEYLSVNFAPIILKNLIFPNIYSILNLSIVNALDSKFSLPLYECIYDYRKLKKFKIKISTLRELIGIDPDKYKVFSWFKKSVLNPTIEEINAKTDILVDYELEKTDGEYTHIEFFIKEKYDDMSPVEVSAYQLLKSRNIPDAQAKRFAKQISKQRITEAIDIMEKSIKKTNIKNTVAYLTRVLKNVEVDDESPENCEKLHNSKTSAPVQLSDYKPLAPTNIVDSSEFKQYIKNRIIEIIQTLSFDAIEEFVATQNDFAISHLVHLGLIDENKEIINLKLLKENFLFLSFVENKYFEIDSELKKFKGEINE